MVDTPSLQDDSYGYSSSQREQAVIKNNPLWSNIFTAIKGFSLNHADDQHVFNILGADFANYIKQEPFQNTEPFILRPSIYLSPTYAPDFLPEILSHEFGHVYQMSHAHRYSSEGNKLIYSNGATFYEGFAENFAWFILHKFYKQNSYPELEFFHILKYRWYDAIGFNSDPHYVGSASMLGIIQGHEGISKKDIFKFAYSSSFAEVLDKFNIPTAAVAESEENIVKLPIAPN